MTLTEFLAWVINVIAILAWLINIKSKYYAIMLFTLNTVLGMWYFSITHQTPFLIRGILFLVIDIATLYECVRQRRKSQNPDST